MSREVELKAEVAMAISRLTQILANEKPTQPPIRKAVIGGGEMTIWLDHKAAQVLTDADGGAVHVRGDLRSPYHYEGDMYALFPDEAIALGHALVAAGLAASTGNVVAIGGAS